MGFRTVSYVVGSCDGWVCRYVPFGPIVRLVPGGIAAGHPESLDALLPPEHEALLAGLDADLFREPGEGQR